jgi:MoaA/NifB/PqqE/SkfB family radical SAM enzyme
MKKTYIGLVPKVLGYKLFRSLGHPKLLPMNMTVGVTSKCNSKCKTCHIWQLYRKNPELEKQELKTYEFEKIFKAIGRKVFYVVVTGGEPFLRPDLNKICKSIWEYCSPHILVLPTNGLLPEVIEKKVEEILVGCPDLNLVVNFSLDGIGREHDEIRGIPGNYEALIDAYQKVKKISIEFPKIQVGIHTVISKYNIHSIPKIYEVAKKLEPHSFITEIAEERTELFNVGSGVGPDTGEYRKTIRLLSKRVRKDRVKLGDSRLTQALRLAYYELAERTTTEGKQIIPCYAGFASCQITPFGDVWPCCILGYNMPMGNLRQVDYVLQNVWNSPKADRIRYPIRNGICHCPLANASYTNILCNSKYLGKTLMNLLH